MPDLKYVVYLDGDASGFGAAAKKAASELNALDKFESKSRKNQQLLLSNEKQTLQLAKQQRREAFDKLSVEEKTNKLLAQRSKLLMLQERMQARGNVVAASSHKLALAQTNAQLKGLQGQGGILGAFNSFKGGLSGGMMAGGIAGAAGGAGMAVAQALLEGIAIRARQIMMAPFNIAGAAGRMVMSSINEGDQLADTAEEAGTTPEKLFRFKTASSRAGIKRTTAMRTLQFMRATRSQAATDPELKSIYAQYRVGQSDLKSDKDILDISTQLFGSLGKGGVLKGDIPGLRKIGGPNVEKLALVMQRFAGLNKDQSLDDSIKNLDAANTGIEAAETKYSKVKMGLSSGLITAAKALFNKYVDVQIKEPAAKPGSVAERFEGSRTAAMQRVGISQWNYQNWNRGDGDQLTRIGLFRGGTDSGRMDRKQQIKELQNIVKEIQTLSKTMADESEVY
jgi:hypothetical protein